MHGDSTLRIGVLFSDFAGSIESTEYSFGSRQQLIGLLLLVP
jgi:hypothetical protein